MRDAGVVPSWQENATFTVVEMHNECIRAASMSFSSYPSVVGDRGILPQRKSDQRPDSPLHHPELDTAIFKVPYPYKRRSSPFQPVPRRVRPLHQPWLRPHARSAFTHYQHWTEINRVCSGQSRWSLAPCYDPRPASYTQQTPPSFECPALHNGFHCEDKSQCAERETSGRRKGVHIQRKDGACASAAESKTLMSSCASQSADAVFQRFHSRKPVKPPRRPAAEAPFHEKERRVPCDGFSQSSSAAPNSLPWLLPHFEAGSLVELRDGRLRRVENLQTEDFLLGSLACPDLRLSCCTVQRISSSELSPAMCRLLLLLHEPHSQELVDVHMEYPFFVRDQGWSSCSPHRTARLCGLRCRQLGVGDVCLALTPASAPRPPPPQEPQTPPSWTGRCEKPALPPGLQTSAAGQGQGPEGGRRRHSSAPG